MLRDWLNQLENIPQFSKYPVGLFDLPLELFRGPDDSGIYDCLNSLHSANKELAIRR